MIGYLYTFLHAIWHTSPLFLFFSWLPFISTFVSVLFLDRFVYILDGESMALEP
jgi:hypothetical protein